MQKSLFTGLGGAQPSPNLLPYGHFAPSAVCKPAHHASYLRPSCDTHPAFPALASFSFFVVTSIVTLLLAFHLCTPPQAFAAQAQSTATSKSPNSKSTTVTKAPLLAKQKLPAKAKTSTPKSQAPHADAWAFGSKKPRPVDSIWTQGLAPQALKNAAVTSLKDKALKKGLNAPEVPPVLPPKAQAEKANRIRLKANENPLGKGMPLRGDFDSVSSSWHSSGLKNDLRIDQDMSRQETNIYGAYADLEAGEDFTLSAGPEFSHTRTQNATQNSSHSQSDSSSLGLGLHLKWDF